MMRKAQIQMAETIAILLVFFVIIGISLAFYGVFQTSSLREVQREQFDKEAIRVALLISHLPEIACSDNNLITQNCLDKVKVQGLNTLAQQRDGNDEAYLFYQTDFRNSKVTIQEVFPNNEIIFLYDNPPVDYTEIIPTFIPVTIKDPLKSLQAQNSLGVLTVEVYR